jgi:hypothetical protein
MSNNAFNNLGNKQIVYPSTIPAKVVPPLINVKKFASYSDLEQQMFYALRQGLLTMMPNIDDKGNIETDGSGSFEAIAVQQAELFAATVVDSWPIALKTYPVLPDATGVNGQATTASIGG